MLTSSFTHLHGIGRSRERKLWEAGIRRWGDLLRHPGDAKLPAGINRGLWERVAKELEVDLGAVEAGHFAHFLKRLKRRDHWKLYRHFPEKFAFLDIETTGLRRGLDRITCIALYRPFARGEESARLFVQGFNLDEFPAELAQCEVLASFAGTGFDLPFLRSAFPGLRVPEGSVDLLWLSRGLGLKGGLKKIERRLGLTRSDETDGLSGADAVVLWRRWEEEGHRPSLERLLVYNLMDTINLHPLLVMLINMVCDSDEHASLGHVHLQVPGRWSGRVEVPGLGFLEVVGINAEQAPDIHSVL